MRTRQAFFQMAALLGILFGSDDIAYKFYQTAESFACLCIFHSS